MTDTKFSS